MSSWAGPGPWVAGGTGWYTAGIPLATMRQHLGDPLPSKFDAWISLSKPSLSILGGNGSSWALYQITTKPNGSDDGVLLAQGTLTYGTRLQVQNLPLDPALGGVALYTGNDAEAVLQLTKAGGPPPANTGGIQTKSWADQLVDAADRETEAIAKDAIWAGVLIVAILIAVVLIQLEGPAMLAKAAKGDG